MKHIKFILTLATLFIITGCELDREPKGQVSSSVFWTTQDHVERALIGCYGKIPGNVYDAYLDGYADNSLCQYPWESNALIVSSGTFNTGMNAGYNFEGIRRFNYFLDNIDRVKFDETLKNQYKAEVRVIRAWNYFNLANKFGAVPLFKKSIKDSEDAKRKPTSEKEVIDFVLKELAESAALLPKESVKSRISKGAALTLKARIELAYSKWSEASKTAKEVMGLGYSLFKKELTDKEITEDDDYSKFITFANANDKKNFYNGFHSYEGLFLDANKENSEVILNSESIKDNYNYIALYLLSSNVGGGWSSVTPTVELVNAYWKRDGSKFTPPTKEARATAYNKGNPTANYIKEFQNRDTRLYATVLFPQSMWKAMKVDAFQWTKGSKNTSKTGYNYRKMVDPKFDIWHHKVDYPVLRYAEVLLTYAEAKNEASGPDATIFDALDLIRSRAGMPNIDRVKNNTKEALRETIRNERRIELAGEGLRWLDVRRWNIAKDVMVSTYAVDGDLALERKWEEKFKRLPYPQEAVDRNPNLKEAQAQKGY